MDTIIVAVIIAFAFIFAPMAFMYILVVMPLKKRIRCSEKVDGIIKWIDKEVRTSHDSDGRHFHGVYYIATCDYNYEGKEYTSTIESRNKKFKVLQGEVLTFYINPKNPLETYYRNVRQILKMLCATAFLSMFIYAGVVAIKDFVTPTNEDAPAEQVNNTDVFNKDSDTELLKDVSELSSDKNEEAEESISQEEKNFNRIILNKDANNDMNTLFIEKSRKVTHGEVTMYMPECYELQDGNEVESNYADTETGDQFKILVGYTDFTKKKVNEAIKKELKEKPVHSTYEYYNYNGYRYKIMYAKDVSRTIFVACVANDKTVFIKFVPSKKSKIDLRDLLSTMII